MGSLATSPHLAPSPRWLAALHEEVLALELQIADLQPAIKAIAAALSAAGFAPARVSVSILTVHPALAGLGNLERLRITGSGVSAAGLQSLAGLRWLQKTWISDDTPVESLG